MQLLISILSKKSVYQNYIDTTQITGIKEEERGGGGYIKASLTANYPIWQFSET